MKRAQVVTQRVGTGEIGERARIHIGWAKILPSLHGEDDDNGDNDGDNNGERAWNGKKWPYTAHRAVVPSVRSY